MTKLTRRGLLGAGAALPTPEDLSENAEDRARRKLDRLSRERDEMGPVNLRAEVEESRFREVEYHIGHDSENSHLRGDVE